jgi:hypothetical protein
MTRAFIVAVLSLWLVGAAGCAAPAKEERRIWQGVKLGDLAPPPDGKRPKATFLATVQMNVHIFELPAQNVDQLDDLWAALSAKSIAMSSYNAFSDNSFRVKFGRIEMWEQIHKLLAEAEAQKVGTVALPVVDSDTTDLGIATLPANRSIVFTGNDLSSQSVTVGPGMLVLRLRSEPIPWARGVRKIIAYPTFTLPTESAIPQLSQMVRRNEFYFSPAAFAVQMGPGDLVVLGPDSYTGEQATLGGLFFARPQGRLFLNPNKPGPPQYKPAVRLYILVCSTISEQN